MFDIYPLCDGRTSAIGQVALSNTDFGVPTYDRNPLPLNQPQRRFAISPTRYLDSSSTTMTGGMSDSEADSGSDGKLDQVDRQIGMNSDDEAI